MSTFSQFHSLSNHKTFLFVPGAVRLLLTALVIVSLPTGSREGCGATGWRGAAWHRNGFLRSCRPSSNRPSHECGYPVA
jgi:hypothetical protein